MLLAAYVVLLTLFTALFMFSDSASPVILQWMLG